MAARRASTVARLTGVACYSGSRAGVKTMLRPQAAPEAVGGSWPGLRVNALDYLARSVEILVDEVYQTDVRGALRFNTLKKHWEQVKPLLPPAHPAVQAIESVLRPLRYAEIIEIKPERHIIRNALNFAPARIRENYEYGKALARSLPPLPERPVA